MFFKKKGKEIKCTNCSSKVSKDFSFCPYCASPLTDPQKETRDFGMLGRNDSFNGANAPQQEFGIADKMVNSLVNSLMKSLNRQFQEMGKETTNRTEIKTLPNGIRIKISPGGGIPEQQAQKQKVLPKPRSLTEEQLKKISKFPRAAAKTSIKRLNDRVIYELATPGVSSPQDVFISKLENGYEVKALGSKKIYVNSIPVELPLKSLSLGENKLLIEFGSQNQQ